MKSTTSVWIVTALGLGLLAPEGRGAEPWVRQHQAVPVPMRDGAALVADVYLPEAPGRYPTILVQTPYSRKRMAAALPDDSARERLFDRDHYAVVVLDWRGFYDSKAARKGAERPQIGKDGADAVEWIARQDWSDGKVGTWGPSALGRVQFATALEQPEHLVCCVPIVAPHGYSYDDYYENGVLREADVQMLDRLGFALGPVVRPATRSTAALYKLAAQVSPYDKLNVPMLIITGWYDHGLIRQLETFENLRLRAGPVARKSTKLLIGPWHHMSIGKARQGALEYPGAANERDRMSQKFFDRWLRDQKESGWDDVAVVRWWQMGEERWLSALSLSAVKTSPRTFYLGESGLMSEELLNSKPGVRKFRSDPRKPVPTVGGANLGQDSRSEVPSSLLASTRPGGGADVARDDASALLAGPQDQAEIERRDDVLVYQTAVLAQPLRIFGRAAVRLTFAVDQRDASFAVRLCDVYPDGRSMLVCDSILRARYREGTAEPLDVEPRRMYQAMLKLPPVGLTIAAGHRLRISIAGSNYPRYELNPHTGADHYDADSAVAAWYTVFHEGGRPSTVTLPILESP